MGLLIKWLIGGGLVLCPVKRNGRDNPCNTWELFALFPEPLHLHDFQLAANLLRLGHFTNAFTSLVDGLSCSSLHNALVSVETRGDIEAQPAPQR